MDSYEPGELFVYVNGDRWELGQVKRENNDGTGYFCWYSTGDTCANTPTGCMHKLANAGWSHIEKRPEPVVWLDEAYDDGTKRWLCECPTCGASFGDFRSEREAYEYGRRWVR